MKFPDLLHVCTIELHQTELSPGNLCISTGVFPQTFRLIIITVMLMTPVMLPYLKWIVLFMNLLQAQVQGTIIYFCHTLSYPIDAMFLKGRHVWEQGTVFFTEV